ncbi:MAG: hypothetical protein CL988_03380 [Euryarchaeota archaeon]|nr:hypothetical protein [Euryarchaeota archaeon]
MTLRIVTLGDLGDDVRASMSGARWLLLNAAQLDKSTPLLMFTELDDILVAVDHRGAAPQPGLWQRAVHLILIDGTDEDAEDFRKKSGITKVVAGSVEDIRTYLW